ncbi:cornichon [Yarrowia lipolytica]|jgi:hypothetical protein|uniref:YALI0F12001p n=2 Tax=Yarrowia lipolytica TaxID=4952 RepID=Q6C200_YARLI|nr:YALI0F12001p [Yarrowia lipolytica CLIB122]AOW07030.1 hypothetical protein YALI1_F15859g [Yarrowia lipolytica]KAB8282205.1 cornichon [Yarrowia lipolytica]KAE8172825.1 cornichon [Yarrowia lipolytica]KAJ8055812.1 cornichon [Yarrowia lipolytica]QNQ00690.1 ER-derived vesicles protein ERV14 [Yarrowia lipolytica]|eukprot:XP_505312.2 YALI0F12001p [Yarrowia lipolytica CLIB122]
MAADAYTFIFAILISLVNLFLQVFFTIMYSDLECDYINPIDLCNRLNNYVLPEAAAHAALTIVFLLTGHWIVLLLNAPIFAYNAHKIYTNTHLLDATEIFRTLKKHKQESFIKLACYLVFFFLYLYCMIAALVRED